MQILGVPQIGRFSYSKIAILEDFMNFDANQILREINLLEYQK